ncbi:MAG: His/Gly/Thr/Pro-type tRNA ligase C-terminal domain-containing protein, partial [Tepidimonas sp.]
GLKDYRARIGTRDPKSDKYVGDEAKWSLAERQIEEAALEAGLHYTVEEGDAAFYGPKLDFVVKDALGREWQLGTIQVDYNLPERFGLTYVGPDGAEHRPVMIHRAIVGSLERFIGILIEQHAGALPAWLSPTQVAVLNITDAQSDYCGEIAKTLQDQGFRVALDLGNEKITYKIRQQALQKVPYILVVGDKEKAAGTVAVRARGNQDLGVMPLADFAQRLRSDIASKH